MNPLRKLRERLDALQNALGALDREVSARLSAGVDRYQRLEQRIHDLELDAWSSVAAQVEQEKPDAEITSALPGLKPGETLEGRLAYAIAAERALCFGYTKEGEELSAPRTLSPYELIKVQNGLVVRGWDHEREAIRSFRLDRIGVGITSAEGYRAPEVSP